MTTQRTATDMSPKIEEDEPTPEVVAPKAEMTVPKCGEIVERGSDATAPKDDIVAPQWTKGDAWVVRYCVEQPTLRGDLQLVEILWEYRVVDIDDTGRVDILAHRLTYDIFGDWHLFFASTGQFLGHRAGMSANDILRGPYLSVEDDWNAEALPKAWPAFPLKAGARKKHRNGVLQEAFADPAGRRVVLRASGDGNGVKTDKTMEQIWEPGRPFWSSIKIESVSQLSTGPYHSVDIEGVVIDWQPAARNP